MFPDTSRTGSPKVCRAFAKSSPMVTTFGPTSIGRTQRMSSPWTEILGQVTLCRTLGRGLPFKNLQDRFPNMLNCQKDGFPNRQRWQSDRRPLCFAKLDIPLLSLGITLIISNAHSASAHDRYNHFCGGKIFLCFMVAFLGALKELQPFYKESPRS